MDGSKLTWSSDRPQAAFHRISNFSASAVCGSDRSCSSLSTSTDPTRSAGSDGRPVPEGNKSAVNESGNSSPRCSARNANTLPGGTRCPATAAASSSSRSCLLRPCITPIIPDDRTHCRQTPDPIRVIQSRPRPPYAGGALLAHRAHARIRRSPAAGSIRLSRSSMSAAEFGTENLLRSPPAQGLLRCLADTGGGVAGTAPRAFHRIWGRLAD